MPAPCGTCRASGCSPRPDRADERGDRPRAGRPCSDGRSLWPRSRSARRNCGSTIAEASTDRASGSGELVAEPVRAEAATAGDRGSSSSHGSRCREMGFWGGEEGPAEELEQIAREAIPLFERAATTRGSSHGMRRAIADVEWQVPLRGRARGERTRRSSTLEALATRHEWIAPRRGRHGALLYRADPRRGGPRLGRRASLAGADAACILGLHGQRARFPGTVRRGRAAIAEWPRIARASSVEPRLGIAAGECRGELELLAGDPAEAERQIAVGIRDPGAGRPARRRLNLSGYLARVLGARPRRRGGWRDRRSEELGAATTSSPRCSGDKSAPASCAAK